MSGRLGKVCAVFKSEAPTAVSVIGAVVDDLTGAFPAKDRGIGDEGAVGPIVELSAGVNEGNGCGVKKSCGCEEDEKEFHGAGCSLWKSKRPKSCDCNQMRKSSIGPRD